MRDASLCVSQPEVSNEGFASLATPTYRASTIVFPDAESYRTRSERGLDGYSYGLHGTPTTKTLEAQITALEGGEHTVIVPSGQAGITVPMLSVLMPGDTVLVPDTAYPPATDFCRNFLAPRGIAYRVYRPDASDLETLVDDTVKLIWMESPGSTTMEVQDVPAIVAFAKARGILTGIDNTWATPLLFKPLAHGVDFSMQALTKHAGGHSDLLLGSISVTDAELREKLRDTMRMLGMGVGPDEVSLALRGIQTMSVRVAHSGKIALDFAERLETMPGMDAVLHPGLSSSPGHALWKRDFAGACGVFSVVLPASAEARLEPALDGLRLFSIGASWGGTHSLVAPMSVAANRVVDDPMHARTILRVSVGLEDPEDLWIDLERLFAALLSA